jgi:hypothetical protein
MTNEELLQSIMSGITTDLFEVLSPMPNESLLDAARRMQEELHEARRALVYAQQEALHEATRADYLLAERDAARGKLLKLVELIGVIE